MAGATGIADAARRFAIKLVGGRAGNLPIVLILGSVLGLDAADKGALSAVAGSLERDFGVGFTEVGLLFATVSFIGAVGTLPVGILADRIRRKNILLVAVPIWTLAMILSGTASSYLYLLLTRLLLGAATAAAWPCIASLTGDFFPARQRAEMYGLIVAGEMVGAGVGYFISAEVSSWANWHWAFYVMALPGFALSWALWRYLPEPERRQQAWLGSHRRDDDAPAAGSVAQKVIREGQVKPRQALVLRDDPTHRTWLWAIRYLFRIPTYLLLIVASALGYYFFSGMRAFVTIYFTQHYGMGRAAFSPLIFIVGIGGLIGVIASGRISGWFLNRGKLTARIIVPGIALLGAALLLAIGIWVTNPLWGVASLTVGAALLAAAIPPIDAARLDIIHPALWGRGESGRTALREALEGAAPLLFGIVSTWLGGGTQGLERTFLLMLLALLAASALAIPACRTYPRDVATAAASLEETAKKSKDAANERSGKDQGQKAG